jgi:L-ascorbate metabolism protein UlaG (beta-lactamase superfamily)
MKCKITMINHASVLIQLAGINILTDPIYSRSVGFVAPRMQKAGIPIDDLPEIDLILISHNDYDHLNISTLRKLSRRHDATVIVPTGDGKYAYKAGFSKVVEMECWGKSEFACGRIHAVPAKHKSSRSLFQRNKRLCSGYIIEDGVTAVYFAGDTGYGDHFKMIAEKFNIDAALLPIGAYKPYDWFREIHLNPKTALQAFLDLRAGRLIPMHWGTFKISDEPLREPPKLLKEIAQQEGIEEKISILENGESVVVE